MNGIIKRDERGRLLPGTAPPNPGGRPRGVIEDVRERLGPYTQEFEVALVELVRSQDETVRLAAIKEAFDRLMGKAPLAIDSTVAKIDMGALYLAAVKSGNTPASDAAIDVTPIPPADAPVANSTHHDEW
jgi:hypothetical protein